MKQRKVEVVNPSITSTKEEEKTKGCRLHKFHECPEWMQDNHFIQSGYRVNYSFYDIFWSLFTLHNETFNIWTHFLSTMIFIWISAHLFSNILQKPTFMESFSFIMFSLGTNIQMFGSSIYHLFGCYSSKTCEWLAKVDYIGITAMIVGCYYPPFYYLFRCQPLWQFIYLGCITTLGIIAIIVSCIPVFSTPRFRVFRAVFFVTFSLFVFIPMPHMISLHGGSKLWPVFWRELVMGANYIIGAFIYATRIPERYFPGKFDISFISSHVIWHYFTIIAALMQWYVAIYLYKNRDEFCPM